MGILGFDTATAATTVAVCTEPDALAAPSRAFLERRDDPPSGARPGHTAQLLPLIRAAIEDAGAGPGYDAVTRLAVGVGPGTFTGLRIGVATARALARARGIPLVGVSTLQSLGLMALAHAHAARASTVAAVIDARRGELFAAAWGVDDVRHPGAVPVLEPRPYAPEALVGALDRLPGTVLAVGDAAPVHRAALEAVGVIVPDDAVPEHRVSAIGHCRLGAAVRLDPACTPDPVLPDDLSLPDAELARLRAVAGPS